MPTVADALRQHAPAYLQKFADRVPLGHRKVLSYIMRCRTGQLGSVLYRCQSCQSQHWVDRACGNRHCPNCQKQKTSLWLASQTGKLLPVQHFVVTFTVPAGTAVAAARQSKDGLRRDLQGRQPNDSDVAGQSPESGQSADWILRRAAHLGTRPERLPSTRALRRAWRGSQSGRSDAGCR